ncbi:MAG: DUF2231 domain-containing protein [Gammaproteobacteria bacterium]|nr:DUF2231 domain-containing protein [Gammaproteobacteria bacterium]
MPEIIPNWHPMFVHFSVALLSLTVLLHLLTKVVGGALQNDVRLVARWCLWMGAVAALFTGATGIYAFNTVAHDTPSHLAMIEHRNLALPTILFFAALAIWSFMQRLKVKEASAPFLLALLVAGGLLASTAWHGAELVYRHGLGVMSLPDAAEHDHAAGHDHADGGHGHDNLDSHPAGDGENMSEEGGETGESVIHLHKDGSAHQH